MYVSIEHLLILFLVVIEILSPLLTNILLLIMSAALSFLKLLETTIEPIIVPFLTLMTFAESM